MRLISWNVNGVRAAGRKGLLEFVQAQRPDLLCLQEVKAHREQVEPEIVDMGFGSSGQGAGHIWSAAERKGYSGVATFWTGASAPVQQSAGIGVPDFDREGRVVITDHRRFLLYNIYFPNGGSGPERHAFKQRFLEELVRHLRGVLISGREVIVVGDYNIAAGPLDVYDPEGLKAESGFLPEERLWMEQFLALGFVDSFRWVHGASSNRFSWWNQIERARDLNRGWRIDYACLTRGLLPRLEYADILDDVMGSDHAPVLLELSDEEVGS